LNEMRSASHSMTNIEHFSSFVLGISIFYFYPIIGNIKPFDIIAGLFILIHIKNGVRFLKYDLLFLLFIYFAILSLALATPQVFESSLLQTLRYFIYFIAARIVLSNNSMKALLIGIKYSFVITFIYITIDIIYYYVFSDNCTTVSYLWMPQDTEMLRTVRSGFSLPFLGSCAMIRATGFSWDPGGLYPLLIVVGIFFLNVFNQNKFFHYSGLFSILAISRTGFLTYIIGLIALKSRVIAIVVGIIFFIVVPLIIFIMINNNDIIIDFGTARHLTYSALAFKEMLVNPIYYFSGEGIRGGGNILLHSHSLPYYFTKPEQTSSTLVVESIWLNILMGTGLIGFIAYMGWMTLNFAKSLAVFATLFIAGTFYTFDSSQFCFLVPFMMRVIKDKV